MSAKLFFHKQTSRPVGSVRSKSRSNLIKQLPCSPPFPHLSCSDSTEGSLGRNSQPSMFGPGAGATTAQTQVFFARLIPAFMSSEALFPGRRGGRPSKPQDQKCFVSQTSRLGQRVLSQSGRLLLPHRLHTTYFLQNTSKFSRDFKFRL